MPKQINVTTDAGKIPVIVPDEWLTADRSGIKSDYNHNFESAVEQAVSAKQKDVKSKANASNPALSGVLRSMNAEPEQRRLNKTLGLDIDPVNSIIRGVEAFAGGSPVRGASNLIDAAGDLTLPLGAEALVNAPLKKSAIALGSSMLGSKAGSEVAKVAGGDEDAQHLSGQLGAIAGGSLGVSPKLRGGIKGAVTEPPQRSDLLRGGAGYLMTKGLSPLVGNTTAGIMETAGTALPIMTRGALRGSAGKPWIDPAFFGEDRVPAESSTSSPKQTNIVKASVSGSKSGTVVEQPKQLGAAKHPTAEEDTALFNKKEIPKTESKEPSNKKENIRSSNEEKVIVPKSHVEQHASDNAIDYDEALSHYPSEDFEVLDKRGMMNRVHGTGRTKGLSPVDVSQLAKDQHGKSLSQMDDATLHKVLKHLKTLEDNPLKTVPKSAYGLDKDPLRGITK